MSTKAIRIIAGVLAAAATTAADPEARYALRPLQDHHAPATTAESGTRDGSVTGG